MSGIRRLMQKVRASKGGDHAKIAKSLLWIVLLVGGAKIVGALKEVALAAKYGTSPSLDAYSLVFNFANWPSSVLASVLASVLIPTLITLQRSAPAERAVFFGEVIGVFSVIGLACGAAFGLGLELALRAGLFGLAPEVNRVAIAMALPLCLTVPAGVIAALLSVRLMSGQKFFNTFLEATPSIVLLAAVLLQSGASDGRLIWGTVVGFAAYVLALLLVQPRPWGELAPRLAVSSPHWKSLGAALAVMALSQTIFTMGGAVADQVLVAPLGPGSNATLGYANRLLMLVIALGATAVGRATLPVFTEARLRDPGEEVRLARKWMLILFAASLVAVAVGALVAPIGIKLLFERGAFTAQDTRNVTEVFRYGLISVPFYFSGIALVQLIASRQKYGLFLISNVACVVVKIGTGLLLVDHFGINGVMVSTAIMYLVSTLALYILCRRMEMKPKVASHAD